MSRLKLIADEKIPFLHGVFEPWADVLYLPGNRIRREMLIDTDAILIRTRTKCDKSLLEGTSVKFIATATIGYDHIDTEYCREANIKWVNAPGCNSTSVMQYLLAALLTIADKHNFDLSEKTIGIVGVGNVGSKVQAAARILGMNVKICDPPRARSEGNAGFVTFDEIVRSCNIITLHVPLVAKGEDKTYHLFDKGVFEKIKKETWLINSSRGEVIETRAINDAMNAGLLKGAILDVWENEPDIDIELLRRVFISTPHIAGYSTDGKANGTSQVVRALSDFFGLPPVNFYPQSLQPPLVPDILIDGAQKSTIQIIVQAVLHTYPIMDDHLLLQNSPETFEQQRGNYPLRREFTAFTVRLSNANPESTEALRKLGFIVLKS